ncbi:MAG: RNA polymerase sigma factor [Cyclobacteriaceae bacterium]|nr:RNA polymerase sigma factor [Cyclobacteriaceae bacterium]
MKTLRQPSKSESAIISQSPYLHKSLQGELPDLWEKFQGGNSSALTALYRQYVQQLYNYGRQFAEHAIVQDCIQDVFYDLIRKRENLKSVQNVKAFLFACLRHRVIKQLKKLEKQQSNVLVRLRGGFGVDLVEVPFEDREVMVQEEIDKLKAACNQLTDRQREAVLLYYYEKLSYKELTTVMQLGKISSARILMHRAMQSLRKILCH